MSDKCHDRRCSKEQWVECWKSDECKIEKAQNPDTTSKGLDGSSGLFAPVDGADSSARPVHSLAHSLPHESFFSWTGGVCPICKQQFSSHVDFYHHVLFNLA